MEECTNRGLYEYPPSKEPGVTWGACKENIVDVRGEMGGENPSIREGEEEDKAKIYKWRVK